jgi:hypothetical protein
MEHRCPFAQNPLSNPMIQLLWTSQNSESVGSILFYKVHTTGTCGFSDLPSVTWESLTGGSPMWWGPRAVRASQGQVREGKSGSRSGHQRHSCGMSGYLQQSAHRVRSGHQRKAWPALGISSPLYRYTSVHGENTLAKLYIRMVLGHLHRWNEQYMNLVWHYEVLPQWWPVWREGIRHLIMMLILRYMS